MFIKFIKIVIKKYIYLRFNFLNVFGENWDEWLIEKFDKKIDVIVFWKFCFIINYSFVKKVSLELVI